MSFMGRGLFLLSLLSTGKSKTKKGKGNGQHLDQVLDHTNGKTGYSKQKNGFAQGFSVGGVGLTVRRGGRR